MSGENSELPAGWASTPLKDLIAQDGLFNDGDWVESKDQDPNGDVRLIQLADIGDGVFRDRSERFLTAAKAEELQCTFLRTGDVLISRLAYPLGRACIFPEQPKPCVAAVDVCIFRSGSGGVDHTWLMHFINSVYFRNEIELRSSGTTRTRISRKNLGDIEMRVPPLAEQRRIVAKIEALQERNRRTREALSEVGPLLEQFRQSVLAAAFRGDLTADWRAAHPNLEPASGFLHRIRTERRCRWEQAELAKYEAKGQKPPKNWKDNYKEPEPVDDSDLPGLPDGWLWVSLDVVAYSMRSGSAKTSLKAQTNWPILRSSAVRPGLIDFGDVNYMAEDESEESENVLSEGDLMVTRLSGSLDYVGVCAIVHGLNGRRIQYPDRLFRVRLCKSLVTKYIEFCFRYQLLRARLEMSAKSSAGHQRISLSDLRSFRFPLPPYDEQELIAETLTHVFVSALSIADECSAIAEQADVLDQAILAKAFRGELVPQDPCDEPASALLERIRAQRTQHEESAKQTSKAPRRTNGRKKLSRLEQQQLILAEVLLTKE